VKVTQKLIIELPDDPELFFSAYTLGNQTQHTIEIPVHPCKLSLFTIPKLWDQPRYPSTDEWANKMWYIQNGVFSQKKNEIMLVGNKHG
jgi:hypothetical protein